jgi:hypothetical protein
MVKPGRKARRGELSVECIEGKMGVSPWDEGEDWTDEDEAQEGRILDRLIVTAYVVIGGLGLAIIGVMHLLGA